MKKCLYLITVLLAFGCNDPDVPGCLRSTGELTSVTVAMSDFNEIEVNNDFLVIIATGAESSITISAGDNLIPNISYEVIENKLVLQNENGCNWVRDYDFPEVTITTPELTDIRQNGGGLITSDGVLTFPMLRLISEERTGDFQLRIANDELRIISNDLSNFNLSGATDKLIVGFFAGDGRFDGTELVAREAEVFQRGTNDMIIQATERLSGRIISNGNVIYTKTIPPMIDVTLEGTGNLIFKE